jgi:hypothetical protein
VPLPNAAEHSIDDAPMDEQELRELQDPETWDEGEMRPPVASPRAIMAVPFNVDDLELVAQAARQRGVSPIAFMHEAAVEVATREQGAAPVGAASGDRRR